MDKKQFKLWNYVCAGVAFIVSLVTYLLTIEPTASFWDCGEFIASSYKLEVGHPPGNPVFQLIARMFTLFCDGSTAAVAVNAMSGFLSALTIFFLYLTIVFLAKRILRPDKEGSYSLASAIAIFASGLVGSLAYTFSDTFWFSAVEGEVYAMSSLFTALVFWAMTKWYEQADQPHSARWIVLIAFLMGLSIGVHLLNLLTVPCLFFLFYYKKREDRGYSFWQLVGIFALSCAVLLGLLILIQYLPKTAAWFDRIFVNGFGLPFNSGAAFFIIALLAACFAGIWYTQKRGKAVANTVLLCASTILIGFSIFSIVIIRSAVKTPTNEYQPDNPYTLVRYLGREQYGSNPLIYGHTYDAAYEVEKTYYWTPLNGKYVRTEGQIQCEYDPRTNMLFPRMWSGDERHKSFYRWFVYDNSKPRKVKIDGEIHEMPTFGQNLKYFFGYQLNWMYWRYFMWNFVGRQNDVHSPAPGDPFIGNWESGIGFLDRAMLGDQRDAPGYLSENKGKNHYFFLPLLLGILGIISQFLRDKRGSWLTFLLFFMTGIAIVLYLNQPPYQVRERDYAYAGSFYAFCIWIGLGVLGLYTAIEEYLTSDRQRLMTSAGVGLLCMGVPVLMACQNWDDHDRSNRYTAVEVAYNYLNSVGDNGILITHGDNDTFPLWYAQEVEGIRTDVRICNTSLLGTDWYIDQMKYACNESAPLDLSIGQRQYLYGTNEIVYVLDEYEGEPAPIKDVMAAFRDPKHTRQLTDGSRISYINAKKVILPVNRENCLKYGIVPARFADRIPNEIVLTIKNKYLTKPELFMLDLLSNYQWDRPINMLSMGGDIEVGQKEYFMYDGFSYRFVPIKNSMKSTNIGLCDADDLYHKIKDVYRWDALKRTDWFVDYQNYYTFCGVMSQRLLFVNAAKEMLKIGDKARAIELLDMCQECVPEENFPLEMSYLGFSNEYMVLEMVSLYFFAGADDAARELGQRFSDALIESALFYAGFYDICKKEFETTASYIYSMIDTYKEEGETELAQNLEAQFKSALGVTKDIE
ncbi:MAG: DUF2723 domain-containing protein [Bacteroidales bacterium]|nr:DUF2723 domain-containing protein [Bacteroidales bacterium]